MSISDQIEEIRAHFATCKEPSDVYEKIILLGRKAKPLSEEERSDERLVPGCQSRLWLVCGPGMALHAQSDALISNGLAQLLVWAYSGGSAEEILRHDAAFLKELGIATSLSPGRANGLANLLLRIKQEAARQLI